MTAKNVIVILHPINKDFILCTTQLIKCLPLTTSIKPKFTTLLLMQPRQMQTNWRDSSAERKEKKSIANSVWRNILKTLIRGLDKMCLQPQPFCYSAILNHSDSSRDTNNRQKTHSTDRTYISHSKTVLWDSETAWKDRHSICVSECNTETGCWVSQGSPAPNWDLCEVCLTEKCQNST